MSNIFQFLSTENTGPANYQPFGSLRFRRLASQQLTRTPGTPTSLTVYTYSVWLKNTGGTQQMSILSATVNHNLFFVNGSISLQVAGTTYPGSRSLIDPGAWVHLVYSQNGTSYTVWANNTIMISGTSSNNTAFNASGVVQRIGCFNAASDFFDGNLSDINFIDGQALTPSSFGQVDPDTSQWSPILYNGSYGNNGYFLTFSDTLALTSGSNVGLGRDYSGNGNFFNTSNMSVTPGTSYSPSLDRPYAYGTSGRGNYAVLNPLVYRWATSTGSISDSGLVIKTNNASVQFAHSTMLVSSGKWYFEVLAGTVGTPTANAFVGVDSGLSQHSIFTDTVAYAADGTKYVGGIYSAYGSSYSSGVVIGVALDMDARTVTFYRNNVSQGSIALGTSGPRLVIIAPGTNNITEATVNFGQRSFTYTPPTGFAEMHTGSLPSIVNPLTQLNLASFTGGGPGLIVPTSEYPGSSPADPLFSSVSTLMRMETSLTADSASIPQTYSLTGTGSSLDTTRFRFGNGSARFTTPTARYMTAVTAEFGFGTGDFAIEFWFRHDSTVYSGTRYIMAVGTANTSNYIAISMANGGTMGTFNSNSVGIINFGVVPANTWTHIALVRTSGSMRTYRDGVLQGSTANTVNYPNMQFAYGGVTPGIANSGSWAENCNFDEIRITKGSGRLVLIQNIPSPVGLFQPALAWLKTRGNTSPPKVVDSVRGATFAISPSSNAIQATEPNGLTSFNTSTISLGTDSIYNGDGLGMTALLLRGGASSVNNTVGTIPSVVSVNTALGFSIVSYTGNGINPGATIGHGLGKIPGMIIVKAINAATDWPIYHSELPISNTLYLNSNILPTTNTDRFSGVSSTTFTSGINGAELNTNGINYIAYLFTESPGLVRIGRFIGVSPNYLVNCGFLPEYVLIRRTDVAADWLVVDAERNSINPGSIYQVANTNTAEITQSQAIDFYSFGFRIRGVGNALNIVGGTYVFIAFARSPFKHTLGR